MAYNSLSELFTAIANSIRGKTGGTDKIVANDFPAAIEGISGSEDVKAQAKTVTPSTSAAQTVTPDSGYNYLSQVTVEKVPYEESENAAGGTTVTVGGVLP